MIRNKLQVETLEGRALQSATSVFADALVTTAPAETRTIDDWEFAASKEGSGVDAFFIKEVDPRPADEVGSGQPTGRDDPFFQEGDLAKWNRDDPFFRGGEYMWTPSDQKVEPADTNSYMWAETTVGQKV